MQPKSDKFEVGSGLGRKSNLWNTPGNNSITLDLLWKLPPPPHETKWWGVDSHPACCELWWTCSIKNLRRMTTLKVITKACHFSFNLSILWHTSSWSDKRVSKPKIYFWFKRFSGQLCMADMLQISTFFQFLNVRNSLVVF